MEKYLVGLIFLVSSMVSGMESKEIKSVILKDFTYIDKENCFSVFKLTLLGAEPADLTVDDDDGFASLALLVRLIKSGYADINRLAELVNLILPGLQDKVHSDGLTTQIEKLKTTWSDNSISSEKKWADVENFVLLNQGVFSFATYSVTAQNEAKWKKLRISAMGLIAKDKNNDPPAMIVSLKEPIKINHDEEVLLSKMVTIKKSVDMASDPLAKIALENARRYSAKNGEEISCHSVEFQLALNALKSIQAAWPPFSILNQNHRSSYGFLQKALVPDLLLANKLFSFFEDDEGIKKMNAAQQKPALSSPLYFVYRFSWGGGGSFAGFAEFRHWVIEVKQLPSLNDSEFIAQVTIKARCGDRLNIEFFELLFPNMEIPVEEVVSTL